MIKDLQKYEIIRTSIFCKKNDRKDNGIQKVIKTK